MLPGQLYKLENCQPHLMTWQFLDKEELVMGKQIRN